jgi:3-hydroxybutyryl-CoA dehydrogenase
MKNIAVIGAGTMGNGIAHVFAMKGYQVALVDVNQQVLEKALTTIGSNLDRMIKKEKISQADKESALSNIQTFTDIQAGVQQAELVVEAATENPETKKSIFRTLDEQTPASGILATNTSSISITQIAAVTKRPER